jgi:hypothetical protein
VSGSAASPCDCPNGLFVFGVAAFALGMLMVTTGIAPPETGQGTRMPSADVLHGRDATVIIRPIDHMSAGSERRNRSSAARSVRDACAHPSLPTASRPNHGTRQDCGLVGDGIARRTYLQRSAALVHDHLVRRSSNERVD